VVVGGLDLILVVVAVQVVLELVQGYQ